MAPKPTKSRKRLMLQEKLKSLQLLDTSTPSAVMMANFGVSSRFVIKLRSELEKLLHIAEVDGRTLSIKTLLKPAYHEVELKVIRFCSSCVSRSCLLQLSCSRNLAQMRPFALD